MSNEYKKGSIVLCFHPMTRQWKQSHITNLLVSLSVFRGFVEIGRYDGELINEKPNGYGTLSIHQLHTGFITRYAGNWKDGRFHGEGELEQIFSSHSRKYKGSFKDGYKHGYGEESWLGGDYKCLYDNDKMCGENENISPVEETFTMETNSNPISLYNGSGSVNMNEPAHRFQLGKGSKEELRKHYGDAIVFTDTCDNPHFQTVESDELLPGEMSAVTFIVGCYTVRSAQRVYKIHEPGYSPEQEMPADEEEVDIVKKSLYLGEANISVAESVGFLSWQDTLRVTHEISTKHNSDPNGVFADNFKYVCRAGQARNGNWSECIGCIGVIKDNVSLTDDHASLVVLNTYMGSSFSVPYWYKMDFNGELTHFSIHPFAD